jgi:hypothetical protein
VMKRFRRNAEYASDSLAFRPIDRNQRVRVIVAAEGLERRTKGKGCKSGVLGQSALRVLRSLLFDFCAIPTGRCCPSYEAIREMTGFCYATISGALRRLEESGLVHIVRRIIRLFRHPNLSLETNRWRDSGSGCEEDLGHLPTKATIGKGVQEAG